jgi:hypothetical protein
MIKQTEQRRYPRFKLIAGSIAVLNDDGNNSRLGKIINLSKGGLAFACIKFEEENNHMEEMEGNKVDIFRETDEFHIIDLACRIVNYRQSARDFPFNSSVLNNYSVQFVDPTPSQISHLDYFIASSSIPPPAPPAGIAE